MAVDKEKNSYEILGFNNANRQDITPARIDAALAELMKDPKNKTNDKILDAYLELSDPKAKQALDEKLNITNPQQATVITEKYKNNPGILDVKLKPRIAVENAVKHGQEIMSGINSNPAKMSVKEMTAKLNKGQAQGR